MVAVAAAVDLHSECHLHNCYNRFAAAECNLPLCTILVTAIASALPAKPSDRARGTEASDPGSQQAAAVRHIANQQYLAYIVGVAAYVAACDGNAATNRKEHG